MVTRLIGVLTLYLPEPLIIALFLGDHRLSVETTNESENSVSAES
jgi:hypothetical protein